MLEVDGGHRDKVSVIAGLRVSPTSRRPGLYIATEPDAFHTSDKVVGFLRGLLKHLRGNVVVVWDRRPNHRGAAVREFFTRNQRLRSEMPPPWSPEWHPFEMAWSWLKGELANLVPGDRPVLDDEIIDRLIGLKLDPEVLRASWGRS